MPRKTVDLTAQIRRLKKCLDELRYRERAARWARDGLRILEDLDFKHAETRALVARVCSDDGTDKNEMMARCHVMLGREAFLTAEHHFWKRAPARGSPDMTCRISGEEPYFAPPSRATKINLSSGWPKRRSSTWWSEPPSRRASRSNVASTSRSWRRMRRSATPSTSSA